MVVLRLARAVLPIATLYIGKLIIDEVVGLSRLPVHPEGLRAWIESGLLSWIGVLIALELGLALLADALGRAVSLAGQVLADRFSDESSLKLMRHTATLDLAALEDSDTQDRLDRARRQAAGRTGLIGTLFGQAQDVVTLAGFAAGIAAYAPWLIMLLAAALVPAFLGEAYFNNRAYELSFKRTADRRQLDYLRQTGASTETAKEGKLFGLHPFLSERYRVLARAIQRENQGFNARRAAWGAGLAAVGTVGYYARLRLPRLAHRGRHADGGGPHVPGRLVPPVARLARGCADRPFHARQPSAVYQRPVLLSRIAARHRPRPPSRGPSPPAAASASYSRMSASATPAPTGGRCGT